MTVKEIVKQYLESHGHDGLAGDECGCTKDDLFPCEGIFGTGPDCSKCAPAYKGKPPEDNEWGDGAGWWLYQDKQDAEDSMKGTTNE